MSDLLAQAAEFQTAIKSEKYDGYGPRPIPHELDLQVEQFVTAVVQAGPAAGEILDLIDDQDFGYTLCAYAERMATLAVRRQSVEVLESSVHALGLPIKEMDLRDKLVRMPLPWHAAGRLGVDPKTMFERAASALPGDRGTDLVEFAARSPKDQTLKCMGYREGRDSDGFRYERDDSWSRSSRVGIDRAGGSTWPA